MKSRICVKSLVLGAVIMLIGLAVGTIVSPPLIAQRNGVFDTIECKRLVVLDGQGKDAIMLSTTEKEGNGMIIYQDEGKQGLVLRSTKETSSVTGYNPRGKAAAVLAVTDKFNAMQLNFSGGEGGVSLAVFDTIGSVLSVGTPESKAQVRITSNNILGSEIEILDSAGNDKWVAP